MHSSTAVGGQQVGGGAADQVGPVGAADQVDPVGPVGPVDTVDAVTRVLVRACRALADAGRPQEAGRLAGQGWVVLREAHPRQAEHLNGVMHHIARVQARLQQASAAGQPGPARIGTEQEGQNHAH